jgi:hypothetical protein
MLITALNVKKCFEPYKKFNNLLTHLKLFTKSISRNDPNQFKLMFVAIQLSIRKPHFTRHNPQL